MAELAHFPFAVAEQAAYEFYCLYKSGCTNSKSSKLLTGLLEASWGSLSEKMQTLLMTRLHLAHLCRLYQEASFPDKASNPTNVDAIVQPWLCAKRVVGTMMKLDATKSGCLNMPLSALLIHTLLQCSWLYIKQGNLRDAEDILSEVASSVIEECWQLQSNVERLLHLCNGGQESAANRYSKSLEAKFSSEGFRVRAVPHLDTINSHCGLPFLKTVWDESSPCLDPSLTFARSTLDRQAKCPGALEAVAGSENGVTARPSKNGVAHRSPPSIPRTNGVSTSAVPLGHSHSPRQVSSSSAKHVPSQEQTNRPHSLTRTAVRATSAEKIAKSLGVSAVPDSLPVSVDSDDGVRLGTVKAGAGNTEGELSGSNGAQAADLTGPVATGKKRLNSDKDNDHAASSRPAAVTKPSNLVSPSRTTSRKASHSQEESSPTVHHIRLGERLRGAVKRSKREVSVVTETWTSSDDDLPCDEPTKKRSNTFGSYQKRPRRRFKWTEEECDALREGVDKNGEGQWATILQNNPALRGRSAVDLKDKWRNLNK